MADRSLVRVLAAGLRVKAPVTPTTFNGQLRELSGVGFPHEPFPGAWQRNVTVESPGSLSTYAPIYACTSRIAGDVAKLGINLLVDDKDGIPTIADKASPFWRVLRKPNAYQNRIQFITYWLLCKLLFGNVYVLKLRDLRGMVTALYIIDPRRVHPLVTPDGGVYYSIGGDQLSRIPNGMGACPADDIIHDRGPTLWHPLVGVPPIVACAMSGTLGLQIQRNSAAFFANMSRPSGMLTAPGTISETTAERLKREWNQNFSGNNLGKLAVLGDGLSYEAMTIAAEQAQLAQQFGMVAVDCATAYGMPAYKINQGQMPTNNNVQALNQQYYSDCLQVHIEDIELCLQEGLAIPDGYSVEFDLEGLLRMDSLTQMDVLTKGTKGGLLKINEGRRRLRLPPVPGGNTVYMQQQDHSIEAINARDTSADPFGTAKPPTPAPAEPKPDTSKQIDAALDRAGRAELVAAEAAEQMRSLLTRLEVVERGTRVAAEDFSDDDIAAIEKALSETLDA